VPATDLIDSSNSTRLDDNVIVQMQRKKSDESFFIHKNVSIKIN